MLPGLSSRVKLHCLSSTSLWLAPLFATRDSYFDPVFVPTPSVPKTSQIRLPLGCTFLPLPTIVVFGSPMVPNGKFFLTDTYSQCQHGKPLLDSSFYPMWLLKEFCPISQNTMVGQTTHGVVCQKRPDFFHTGQTTCSCLYMPCCWCGLPTLSLLCVLLAIQRISSIDLDGKQDEQ